MIATGFVRTIDEKGKFTIPKDLRIQYKIHSNDFLIIWLEGDKIHMEKYSIESRIEWIANILAKSTHSTINANIYIVDREKVLAYEGNHREKILSDSITKELLSTLDSKQIQIIHNYERRALPIIENKRYHNVLVSQIISPILIDENVVGGIIVEAKEYDVVINEVHLKIMEFLNVTIKNFLT